MITQSAISAFQSIETPFYYYDMELLNKTLDLYTSQINKYGYHAHYALKANANPRILEVIQKAGFGADCVSGNEVALAVKSGFAPEKIVYAGVGKRDKEIRYAIEQGILAINCESIEELQVINQIAGELGRRPDIGLRVNPDIDPKTNRCIDTGQADSKFGISYEEIIENIDIIKS